MRPRSSFWWTATLLLAGGLLRWAFVHWHVRYSGDTLLYGDLAQNVLLHHVYGFTEAHGIRPTLIRLPGHPGFLAACFAAFGLEHYTAVLWVQVGVDLATCWLLGRLAARVAGERAGRLTLGLAALCPFTANYSAVALTETLSLFCVALALLSLVGWLARAREGDRWNAWLVGLGAALAYAVLLRPDQALLSVAVVPAMLWGALRGGRGPVAQARSGPVLAVAAMIVLPLLVWAGRNWRVFHVVEPLAPKYANDPGEAVSYGFYRWYRTWAVEYASNLDVYWAYDGELLHMKDLPARAFDSPAERAETAAVLARYDQDSASTPTVERAFARLAAERVRAHPVRFYLELPVARLADMWLRPRTEFLKLPLDWWRWRAHPGGSALAAGYGLLNALFLGLAGVGVWRWRRAAWCGQPELAWAALGFVALRCALLLTLDNSEPRYTMECYPVVLLLAGLARGLRDGDRRSGYVGLQPMSHARWPRISAGSSGLSC